MRDRVEQKENTRDQEQGSGQDRPDHLPHGETRNQICVQRANAQRQGRRQGKALRDQPRVGQCAGVIQHQNGAKDQIANHRLCHGIDRKSRQQGIQIGNRRVRQQSLGKQQGCRHPVADRIEHHEGQNTGGIEDRKVGAKRWRAETHGKDQGKNGNATHRFQHRPKIAAGRPAIGRGHFAQHQGKHRPPGGKAAQHPVCGLGWGKTWRHVNGHKGPKRPRGKAKTA